METDPERRERLYFMLCDNMYKMDVIDSSYTLKEFEHIRLEHTKAFFKLLQVAKEAVGSKSSIPWPITVKKSTYQESFEEVYFIAAGGFGSVYKAIHKLDKTEYAIKKVILRPSSSLDKYLEEVKTMAKINHPNVVPYKQAWIEPVSQIRFERHLPSTSKSKRSNLSINELRSTQSGNSSYSKKLPVTSTESEESDFDISFRKSRDSKRNNSSNKSKTSTSGEISTSEKSKDASCKDLCKYNQQRNRKYAILFIQMALCGNTLKQWLENRIEPTPIPVIKEIATQALQAIEYIHSKNIVHHDIKPSNIFISEDKQCGTINIQLGDFGLACPAIKESHSDYKGTELYAAPEQMDGFCNKKSDIYSLGIVLIEILIPMKTIYECTKVIASLKAGDTPKGLAKFPLEWVNIVKSLVEKDPQNRPSASRLLQDLRKDKDVTISKLQDENRTLKEEIQRLLADSRKKDRIIRDLKSKLKSNRDK